MIADTNATATAIQLPPRIVATDAARPPNATETSHRGYSRGIRWMRRNCFVASSRSMPPATRRSTNWCTAVSREKSRVDERATRSIVSGGWPGCGDGVCSSSAWFVMSTSRRRSPADAATATTLDSTSRVLAPQRSNNSPTRTAMSSALYWAESSLTPARTFGSR